MKYKAEHDRKRFDRPSGRQSWQSRRAMAGVRARVSATAASARRKWQRMREEIALRYRLAAQGEVDSSSRAICGIAAGTLR